MATTGVRLAMWSGPRNISTALLRSFENRPDTVVVDEPLYAHYLAQTGVPHPGRDEVIAAQDTDWRRVVSQLTAPLPDGVAISYQKHMAHHLLPGIDRAWLDELTHAFLIRHPSEMLASLAKVLLEPALADTGLVQQVELFDGLRARDLTPPVMDARDVLKAPEPMLRRLCDEVSIEFDAGMLSWRSGPRDTDGVWARWWYDAVYASTSFAPYRPPAQPLPERLEPLLEQCLPYYDHLYRVRITP